MFHGLTMVNFDGQTQNQVMVRPWSDSQTVAGDSYIVDPVGKAENYPGQNHLILCYCEYTWKS